MYQYIVSDFDSVEKIYLAKNPFADNSKTLEPKVTEKTSVKHTPPRKKPQTVKSHLTAPLKTTDIKSIADLDFTAEHTTTERLAALTVKEAKKRAHPAVPAGFSKKETRHFVIYEEANKVSREITSAVENLHGNIMLDLIAFSPWTRDNKVFIFFCDSQASYRGLTGRPAWSGGTASLSERKIFVYKSPGAFGIIAHELTHIYFDSFFRLKPNPLWLSEGMATYIQVERGASVPLWLSSNLKMLSQGSGFKFKDLMRIEKLETADEDSVRLWYAQSYSVVRFLMKMKAGDAFYKFCKLIKDGQPTTKALYRAYGMPYNKLSSLEYAWRYDIKTGKLTEMNR